MADTAVRTDEARKEAPRDNVHVLPARYAGHVDSIENGFVRGWARDESAPGTRTEIDVFMGDRELGSTTADRYREDLSQAGMGDGRHAFVYSLPAEARDAPSTAIGVYFHGTRIPLVRPDRATLAPSGTGEAALVELQELTGALRAGLERVAARAASLGREQSRLSEQVAVVERELEERTGTADGERRKAVEAAAVAVREETIGLSRRVEKLEKSFADVDSFLVRIDSSLRRLAETPPPRPPGAGLATGLALFATLAAGLAILAAMAPAAFQGLLRPLLG